MSNHFDTLRSEHRCHLFTSQSNRFLHFTNSFIEFALPPPITIITSEQLLLTQSAPTKKYAVIIRADELFHLIKSEMAHTIASVILKVDIQWLLASLRSEAFFIATEWCKKRDIQLGLYLYQSDSYLYLPTPKYRRPSTTAFTFFILDSSCDDKNSSIHDMFTYLQLIGIPSTLIVPLYIPMAPFPIKEKNCLGYFFRHDLCSRHIEAANHMSFMLAFP